MFGGGNKQSITPTLVRVALEIIFTDSICDQKRTETVDAADAVCDICNAAFATAKALASHRRSKHSIRSAVRFYADADGFCKACQVTFCSRTRISAHITDARRRACYDWLCKHAAPLGDREVEELDVVDRLHRAEARKTGFTQPRSFAPAIRMDGRKTGFIHMCR